MVRRDNRIEQRGAGEPTTVSAVRILPWNAHVAFEYLAGIFLVLSPFVFGFLDTTALPVLLGGGVILLAAAVLSRGRLGIASVLPPSAQAAVEYVLAFFLLVAPFVFGFRRVTDALLVSVLTGMAVLVVSLVTRYPRRDPAGPAKINPKSTI